MVDFKQKKSRVETRFCQRLFGRKSTSCLAVKFARSQKEILTSDKFDLIYAVFTWIWPRVAEIRFVEFRLLKVVRSPRDRPITTEFDNDKGGNEVCNQIPPVSSRKTTFPGSHFDSIFICTDRSDLIVINRRWPQTKALSRSVLIWLDSDGWLWSWLFGFSFAPLIKIKPQSQNQLAEVKISIVIT